MKRIATFVFLMAMLNTVIGGQATSKPQAKSRGSMVSSDEFMAKGGVGIINPRLYIDLNSAKNELILGDGHRWGGQARGKEEIALFFKDKVWSNENLPREFDLSKAIIISFEGDIVRFFDFEKASGGYYKRLKK